MTVVLIEGSLELGNVLQIEQVGIGPCCRPLGCTGSQQERCQKRRHRRSEAVHLVILGGRVPTAGQGSQSGSGQLALAGLHGVVGIGGAGVTAEVGVHVVVVVHVVCPEVRVCAVPTVE